MALGKRENRNGKMFWLGTKFQSLQAMTFMIGCNLCSTKRDLTVLQKSFALHFMHAVKVVFYSSGPIFPHAPSGVF